MHLPASSRFKAAVRSVAGMTNERPEGLLSSLPSELCFNDARDASRRHSKAEKVAGHNLHSIACKSAMRRNMACKTLQVSDSDWSTPMPEKAIKSAVFTASRQTDVSLGISASGLTQRKRSDVYTKPHKFCERLDLFQTLKKLFSEMSERSYEERRDACLHAFQNGWVSSLIPTHWLFSFKGHEGDATTSLVLRAGPHNILCIHLVRGEDGTLSLAHGKKTTPFTTLVSEMNDVLVAQVEPIAVGEPLGLKWKMIGAWKDIPHWIAEHGILYITQNLLSKVCSKLRLPGHTKLDHYHRVELFLTHLGIPQDQIDMTLALLPPKRERKNKNHEQDLGVVLQHCDRFVKEIRKLKKLFYKWSW